MMIVCVYVKVLRRGRGGVGGDVGGVQVRVPQRHLAPIV